MTVAVFWISLALLVYIYAGYPLLVAMLARLFPSPADKGDWTGTVSAIISVRNEQGRIGKKIRSLLACERANLLVEIIVVSDGSTDRTVEDVLSVGDSRVRVVEVTDARGKPSALNLAAAQARGDLLLMTDARQELHPSALSALVANLADPTVGVVSGELVFREKAGDSSAARGIGYYWRYEKFIRRNESAFGSVPGATGALYAMRRSLFRPISAQTLLDDVAIPMQAVASGARCLFEPMAWAFDEAAQTTGQESRRKRRTIAGNAQLIALYPRWLLPWANPIWFQFVSHKLLRLLSPILIISLAISNVMLVSRGGYELCMIAQAIFYSLAGMGGLAQKLGVKAGVLGAPLMLVSMNLDTIIALSHSVAGRYRVEWKE